MTKQKNSKKQNIKYLLINKNQKAMRKVKFKRWITSQWKNVESGEIVFNHQNPGLKDTSIKWTFVKSAHWDDDFNSDGMFHGWGFESQDSGEQMVMDSVAIIELPDGSIELISPSKIKFIKD